MEDQRLATGGLGNTEISASGLRWRAIFRTGGCGDTFW